MYDERRLEDARELLESHLNEFTGYYSYFLYSEVLRISGADRGEEMQRKAINCLEKSIRLNPNFARARVNLGRLYEAQAKWSNALSQFQKASELDPNDATSYYHLSEIYKREGDLTKADEMLAFVTKLNQEQRDNGMENTVRERTAALKRGAQEMKRQDYQAWSAK
jgi:tetratricopeptide (TPR) repeat protein